MDIATARGHRRGRSTASTGQPLLVEPPAEDLRAVDVELDCKTGHLIRR